MGIELPIKYYYAVNIDSSTSTIYIPIELLKGVTKITYVSGNGRIQIQSSDGSSSTYLGIINSSNTSLDIDISTMTYLRIVTGGSSESVATNYKITIRFE